MPIYWDATARTQSQVVAKCENCGKDYTYSHSIGVTRRSSSRNKASSLVGDDLSVELSWLMWIVKYEEYDKRDWWFARDGLGDNACPQCGYVQSWQVNVRRGKLANKIINRVGILAGALAFVVVVISAPIKFSFLLNLFVAWCVAITAFLVVGGICWFVTPHLVTKFYQINRNFEPLSVRYKPQLIFPKPAPAPHY